MADDARPSSAVTKKKQRQNGTVKNGKAKSSVEVSSALSPKDYVESEDGRAAQFAKVQGRVNMRTVWRMYKYGYLSQAGFDDLSILPDGDVGRKNGEPLGMWVPASTTSETFGASISQPLVTPAEQTQSNVLSHERLLGVVNALEKRPARFYCIWASLQYSLQQNLDNGMSITLGEVQDRIRHCKTAHLQAIVKCLKLLKPVLSVNHSSEWNDFQKQFRGLQDWFFPLFGIPWRRKKHSTARMRDRAWLEMSEDVMQLSSGKFVVTFIDLLKAEDRPNNPAEAEAKIDTLVNLLRTWLFYLRDENGIVTKVEDAFDFGIPLPHMPCPDEENEIMALCEGLERFTEGPPGCHDGPTFAYSPRILYSDFSE